MARQISVLVHKFLLFEPLLLLKPRMTLTLKVMMAVFTAFVVVRMIIV
jgi:hypothetical protein